MKYELAKQLKDAGFPQKLHPLTGLMYEDGSPNIPIHCANGKVCYCPEHTGEPYSVIPTLSELIEACGDGFRLLRYSPPHEFSNGTWYAGTGDDSKGDLIGKTPEEAVAKLWLELNKK